MFNQFLLFLREHWELITTAILLLASFVLALLKKKPIWNKMDEVKSIILQKLPIFIDLVEKEGHGLEKKLLVLEMVRSLCVETLGFNNFDDIKSFVSEAIESILSTPQKK